MSDLIDRQAAIDAIDSIGSLDTDADREYARGIFNALPSAQPERKTSEWLHGYLQTAVDFGIITETQAVRIMERVSKYGVTSRG